MYKRLFRTEQIHSIARHIKNADWIFISICVTFIFYTLLWIMIIQPGMPPDELSHVDYIKYLFTERKFPIYGETRYLYDPNKYNAHASIPPLYYLGGTPFLYVANSLDSVTQIFILRLWSLILGTTTVIFAYKASKLLFPKHRMFWIAVAMAVGFNPMFMYISSAVNSDNLINTLYAILTFLLIQGILKQSNPSVKWLIAIGCTLGLGLLTKPTIVPGIIVSVITLCWIHIKYSDNKIKSLLRSILWVFGLISLVSGWWFIRNLHLYGDMTGTLLVGSRSDVYPARGYNVTGSLWDMFFNPNQYRVPFIKSLTRSFWGIFDRMTDMMPTNIYYMLFAFSILGFLGLLFKLVYTTKKYNSIYIVIGSILGLMILITLITQISASYFIDFQPQGRYLFPALVSFTILTIIGVFSIFSFIKNKNIPLVLISLSFLTINILALLTTIAPSHHNRYLAQQMNIGNIQTIYGPFQKSFEFVPLSNHIDSIDLLVDSRNSKATNIDWNILPSDSNTFYKVSTKSSSNISLYSLDTKEIDFIPNKPYYIQISQPDYDSTKSISVPINLTKSSSDLLQPYIKSDNLINAINYIDKKYRSESIYSYRGKIQRYLYIILIILYFLNTFILLYKNFPIKDTLYIIFILLMLIVISINSKQDYIYRIQNISISETPSVYNPLSNTNTIDLISESESPIAIKNPADDDINHKRFIQPQNFDISGDKHQVLFMHPTSSITFSLNLPDNPHLQSLLAVSQEVWSKAEADGVEFVITVSSGGEKNEILRKVLDPIHNPSDRKWHQIDIELSSYANQDVELIFSTLPGYQGNSNYDWAGWGELKIVNQP